MHIVITNLVDPFVECSAKHNRGVREVFEQAARVAILGKKFLDDGLVVLY